MAKAGRENSSIIPGSGLTADAVRAGGSNSLFAAIMNEMVADQRADAAEQRLIASLRGVA